MASHRLPITELPYQRTLEGQEATTSHSTVSALALIAEMLCVGVLLIEKCGHLLFANRQARSILAERDGLVLEHEAVRGVVPREAAQLRRAVAEAARGESDAGAVLFLSRAAGRTPLHLLISTLRPAPTLPSVPAGVALLFISDVAEGCPIGEESLRRRHGLTLAETRVATRIARGECPAEIAPALGVRISTVRTHLKHIFVKTGTQRQSALVRRLLTGTDGFEATAIPPARRPQQGAGPPPIDPNPRSRATTQAERTTRHDPSPLADHRSRAAPDGADRRLGIASHDSPSLGTARSGGP